LRAGGARIGAPPARFSPSWRRKDRQRGDVHLAVAVQGTSTANPRTGANEIAIAVVTADRLASRRIGDVLVSAGDGPVTFNRSAEELLASGSDSLPDAVVLSCAGTDALTLTAIRKLSAAPVPPEIVVVVPERESRALRRALNAGATAVIYESQLEAALWPTIRAALAGQASVPRRVRRCVVKSAFSHREKEVLGLMVRGLTNQQIAHRLFLAESTVKSHLGSAFQKLGVHSRSEAAAVLLDPQEGLGASVLGGDWGQNGNGRHPDSYEIPPPRDPAERTLEG
jgi:DNA-binding NarL/FixJ family response regulator